MRKRKRGKTGRRKVTRIKVKEEEAEGTSSRDGGEGVTLLVERRYSYSAVPSLYCRRRWMDG